jgi:hypothetical protein
VSVHKVGGFLAILVSLPWLLLGGFSVAVGVVFLVGDGQESSDFMNLDELVDFAGAALIVAGAIVLATALWGVVIGAKSMQGRGWARIAGIVTFGFFALGAVGLASADEDDSTGDDDTVAVGVANAIACGAVAVLLAIPSRREG